MAIGHREHERLLEQEFQVQLVVVQRQRQHAGVEAAFAQAAQDDFGLLLDQQQLEIRETLAHPRNHMRQQVGAQRREQAQAHGAGLRIAAAPRGLAHFLHVGDDPPRALGGVAAGRRQHHPPRRALHQRHAQFLLQLADLGRERRLTDEAGRGGSSEMPMIGKSDEVSEVTQVHVESPRSVPWKYQSQSRPAIQGGVGASIAAMQWNR